MGVVINFERVRDLSIAIIGILLYFAYALLEFLGVGGVGIVACEQLTRCGVGKIQIYDYDTIELANMNK